MKFTCLSKGTDYHFPPCHILHVCGFCILLDCPLDLSGLAIFSPIPTDASFILDERPSDTSSGFESTDPKGEKIERPLGASKLVMAEPWYKTVTSLHLWDISFIDFILISSPMGMLGLPFLTRTRGFSAKIYATEASSRLGQLMIEDLVSMHKEFKHFYGPQNNCFPEWIKLEELEFLPSVFKEITLGKDEKEYGAWMPLYSAVDAKDCIQKVETLKYAEEACYNGTLIIKAFSSGLEIGTCNWMVNTPKGNVAFLSSSVFDSALAMDFNYNALQGNDMTIFSDFSFMSIPDDSEDKISVVSGDNDNLNNIFVETDDGSEEMEKLTYICSRVIESVKAGGSVVIPVGRIGIILQLLEFLSFSLKTSNLEVPIFFVSTVAEELLAFANIIPEWLCKDRQNKLYSCEPLFAHVQLLKEKRLHVFPTLYSHELLSMWQEPCIVFCPHWTLRLGPAVPLLHRWCRDPNSLLVMEEGVNVDLALLPFKPMLMNVCRCSFQSGIELHKIKHLLKILQPKSILVPSELMQRLSPLDATSFSVIQYSEGETLKLSGPNEPYKLQIAKEAHLPWKKCKNSKLTRLKGNDNELLMDDGKYRLHHGRGDAESSQRRPVVRWGSVDARRLVSVLQKMGIKGDADKEFEDCLVVRIREPKAALIEIRASSTVISCDDQCLAAMIFDAIESILYGI